MKTSLPDRSSAVLTAGPPGPVTTISLTLRRVGVVKSTSFSRSGVTVSCAATRSTLPSIRAGSSMSRGSGTIATCTLRLPVFNWLLSASSKFISDS